MNLKKECIIVICSRLESERLPGKAMRKLGGVPAIEHILRRTRPIGIETVLAVPETDKEEFQYYADTYGTLLYTGHPYSPLHRMHEAVGMFRKKYVCRITHDDVLIDADELTALLGRMEETGAGYGVTDGIIDGAGVEIFRTENLHRAVLNSGVREIEHISYYVKGFGMPFPEIIRNPCRDSVRRPYRLTMDYPEDAVVLEAIFRDLGATASNDDICHYLDLNRNILRYNRQPELTIYTCAYNAERYIKQCIGSVMDNGFHDTEYIIVEDCSTDGTLKEIMSVASMLPPSSVKIIINEENEGLASSSNVAIKHARGRRIMRLDADDVLAWGQIPGMMALMDSSGAAVVYPNYHEISDNSGLVNINLPGNVFHHAGGALMDKRLLNELKFKEGLKHWDSVELYKRIKGNFPVAYYGKPGFLYRKHNEAMSTAPEREAVLNDLRSGWGANASAGTATSYKFSQ